MKFNATDWSALGLMLRARRKALGGSIEDVARRIGVNLPQAEALERADATRFQQSESMMAIYLRSYARKVG